METAAAPDREERRAPDRRCALRRTVVLGGLFLVFAAGCFCILFYALNVRVSRDWEKTAAEALARGDDVLAAALLQRARMEMSAVPQARIAELEARLFALQERRQAQQALFRERLAGLEKMLDEAGETVPAAALEFAEVARLAPDEAGLEAVRRLRLRHEAMREIADARRAQKLLLELRKLQQAYRSFAAARRDRRPVPESAFHDAENQFADLKREVRAFPELGVLRHEVEMLAEAERAARHEAAARRARRDRSFAELLHGATPEAVRLQCRVFRREFADDPSLPAVRQLEQDLAWCERPFADAVAREEERLREAELRALKHTRQILHELAGAASGETAGALRALADEADRLNAADTAWFLARILSGDAELPEGVSREVRSRLAAAAALLAAGETSPNAADIPTQFRLKKEFLAACGDTLPRFAGVLHILPDGTRQFYPASGLRAHAEAWLPGADGRFLPLGEIHNGQLFPARADGGAAPDLRAVFSPEGPLGSAAGRAEWRRRAAESGLARLPWPEFWPENRRE